MSPAITTRIVTTRWETHADRAGCAMCDWKDGDKSDRRLRSLAERHVQDNPGHIVAIDRGQTRYVQGAK